MPSLDPAKVEFQDSSPALPRSYESDGQRRVRQKEHALQMEIAAQKRRQARIDAFVKAPILLLVLAAIGLTAADFTGIYAPLHLFAQTPSAPAEPLASPTVAQAQEVASERAHAEIVRADAAAPAPAPVTLTDPAPDTAPAQPVEAAPVKDTAQIARLADRVASARRGVDVLSRDLTERKRQIVTEDIALYGTWANSDGSNRHADGYTQKLQQAIDLNATLPANLNPADRQKMDSILYNLRASVGNTQRSIAEDQDVARSLTARLAKAQKDLETAQAAYVAAGGG